MPLIAIEEHWIMPDVTSALRAAPLSDESLAFNEMGDNQQRLEDLAAGRTAAMDAQGVDLSVLALTPPGTHPLSPEKALRLSRAANDVAAEAVSRNPTRFRSLSSQCAHGWLAAHEPGSTHQNPVGIDHLGNREALYGRIAEISPPGRSSRCGGVLIGRP
ncbi:hypothetical protein ACWDWU_32465 [Streptomyces sp. NPDC003442]